MKKRNRVNRLMPIAIAIAFFSGCGATGYDSGNESGTSVTRTADTAADMNVGDIMSIDISNEDASLDFEDVDNDSKFILITGTSNTSYGSSFKVVSDLTPNTKKSLLAELAIPEEDEDEYGTEEMLSAWIRTAEQELAYSEPVSSLNLGKSANLSFSVNVGDVKRFNVIANMLNINTFETITAKARCVGNEIAIFVDTRVNDADLSDEEINDQCESFDVAAGKMLDLLGETSDVNGDGLVTALITPQVNMLGESSEEIVSGYFYAGNLYSDNFIEGSNEQEIIFALAPDPDGEYGARVSKTMYLEHFLPSVLLHELQHAISYNRHVFVNDGFPEEIWLNEGLSHLIEDMMGRGTGNAPRYKRFLASPSNTSLVTSLPNIRERGAAYLFLRFLYEQADDGNSFLAALFDSNRRGVENVEEAFNGSDPDFDEFSEFMTRWTIALAMSDRGISQDPRYTYQTRVEDPQTGNWKGVRIKGSADNGRGTTLNGVHLNELGSYHTNSLPSSSAKYYSLDTVPCEVTIEGGDQSDYAILIRTK